MSYFKNNFRYTLSPGPLQKNTVDEFFFEKKVGFGEKGHKEMWGFLS